MISPRCIITGVTLFEVGEGRCKPADLFIFNGSYIVNASGEGEVRQPRSNEKIFMYSDYRTKHFERRNVFVFAGSATEHLNQAAQEYISKAAQS
jgi:hypothetical protein